MPCASVKVKGLPFAVNDSVSLVPSITVDTPSDTVPSGAIIGTDPPAGTPLPRGAQVKLLRSSGPSLVTMPNVVGQPRAAAEQLLNGTLGFGVQVSLVNGGPSRSGKVISQQPAAGQQAPKGSTVAISVGI